MKIVRAGVELPDVVFWRAHAGVMLHQSRISGTAKLGGKLVLNFGDGFVPKQGESYNVMQAGAFTSAFQTTTIAGLAPGFTYTLSATGGALNLVALNDGVATTRSQMTKTNRP